MFYVYEPDDHYLCEERITSFLKDVPEGLLLSTADLQQATFILLPEEVRPIIGGALLVKKNMDFLHAALKNKLQLYFSLMEEVWIGTIILQFPDNITDRDFESICKIFYRTIYESLVVFGTKENPPFVCLTLTSTEHLSTEVMGLWPYMLEVKAYESSDGLFHGILSLKDAMVKTQWFWRDPELSSQRRCIGTPYSGESVREKGVMSHG